MKTSAFIKFIIFLIVTVVILLLCVQIYNYSFMSLKTEYAIKATMEDSFEVDGIVCRNEYLINKENDGYFDIVLSNGAKVSKGGMIAGVYSKEEDVKAKERIRDLQAQIDEYNSAISAKNSYTGDSSIYDQNIQGALSDYAGAVQNQKSFEAQEALGLFKKQVLIKEIISGANTDYEQIIVQLQAEIKELESSISGGMKKIYADRSGFFTTDVDGYENSLTPQSMESLSVSDFKELFSEITKNKEKPTDKLGKIVLGYFSDYYFMAQNTSMGDYEVGDVIYLRFPSVSDEKIKCEITTLAEENDSVLVGVSCTKAHAELFSGRTATAKVITKSHSGIRVDKDCIRIVDGQNGVYVKVGSIVKFKKVNILYMGTTYALIEETKNGVVAFDEVIVGGRDVYDGKILS